MASILDLPVVSLIPPPGGPSNERRLPPWLRRQLPSGNANHFTARVIEDLRLETVCESARCPNRMECWSQKTATFMILGEVCTRPCGFCSVKKGKTEPLEADEPDRVAEAAARLGLAHVVITSVTRDDLPDGGADHFYRSVLSVRERTRATVEVLTPDFLHNYAALDRVIELVGEDLDATGEVKVEEKKPNAFEGLSLLWQMMPKWVWCTGGAAFEFFKQGDGLVIAATIELVAGLCIDAFGGPACGLVFRSAGAACGKQARSQQDRDDRNGCTQHGRQLSGKNKEIPGTPQPVAA